MVMTYLAVHGAAVDDGQSQLDGLDFDVGAEGVTLGNPIVVAVHLDFGLVRPGVNITNLKIFLLNIGDFDSRLRLAGFFYKNGPNGRKE
jgi:D-serine deaminase-like pyridoxal phosphate-dependent protein